MYEIFDPASEVFFKISNPPGNALLIILNHTIKTTGDLCMQYGDQIYPLNFNHMNPIFAGTSYFGRNLDSFEECLRLAPKIIKRPIITLIEQETGLPTYTYRSYLEILRRNASPYQMILAGFNGLSFGFESN